MRRIAMMVGVLIFFLTIWTAPEISGRSETSPLQTKPGLPSGKKPRDPNEVFRVFRAHGKTETAWRVRWAEGVNKGLYITGAWFRRAPGEAWIQVLRDARLSDIFVPYHPGYPRYFDLTGGYNFGLLPATPEDAGRRGTLLGNPPRVIKEIRDRGVGWKDDLSVYRGEEMVLWGTLDAANYNYVIEYGFRDDGTITFRLGATARNLPGMEFVPHLHVGLWRIDVDLNGPEHDSAFLTEHTMLPGNYRASDEVLPFNGGLEGAADWEAEHFTQVRILDTEKTNSHGRNIAYDLIPLRYGTSRHTESFLNHDFWVTRSHDHELFHQLLPQYIGDGESVTDTDVVLWYASPVHHAPRDEDGEYRGRYWQGSTLIMWTGFDLRPRDLFDRTPFHP